MNTEQLRRELQGHAQHAPAPAGDLADRVLLARRTSNRRRAGLLGAALAIVLVLAGVPLTLAAIRGSLTPISAGQIYTVATRARWPRTPSS